MPAADENPEGQRDALLPPFAEAAAGALAATGDEPLRITISWRQGQLV